MIAPEFLDLEEVLEIHTLQLEEFGGIAGVRDRGLLESAGALAVNVRSRAVSSVWQRDPAYAHSPAPR